MILKKNCKLYLTKFNDNYRDRKIKSIKDQYENRVVNAIKSGNKRRIELLNKTNWFWWERKQISNI